MCTPSNVWVSCFPCNFSNCAITLVHFLPAWQNVCNCAFGHLSRVWRSCTRACIHVLFTCPFVSFPHYSIEFLSLDLSNFKSLIFTGCEFFVWGLCCEHFLWAGHLSFDCIYGTFCYEKNLYVDVIKFISLLFCCLWTVSHDWEPFPTPRWERNRSCFLREVWGSDFCVHVGSTCVCVI